MSSISWSASNEADFDVYLIPNIPKMQYFLLHEMQ